MCLHAHTEIIARTHARTHTHTQTHTSPHISQFLGELKVVCPWLVFLGHTLVEQHVGTVGL